MSIVVVTTDYLAANAAVRALGLQRATEEARAAACRAAGIAVPAERLALIEYLRRCEADVRSALGYSEPEQADEITEGYHEWQAAG